jgi:hypothetical protein
MPEVEYAYTEPIEKTKKHKISKKIQILILFVIAAIVAYFLFFYNASIGQGYNGNYTSANKTFTYNGNNYTVISVPPGYNGSKGLDYIRNNSASEVAEAKTLCTDLLNGVWTDNSTTIGCYSMKDFSTDFCDRGIIKTLVSLCNQINGSYECLTDRIICSV